MSSQTVFVETQSNRYPIHLGRGLAPAVASVLQEFRAARRPTAVLVDASVAANQEKFIDAAFGDLPRMEIPAGESSKSFSQLEACCEFLASNRVDRSGVVVAVGGGVVGDLAGFAAASYLRGIGFYQVPTTLLAMVDSSVGGKTGINLKSGKNLVGAFHQPLAVFADMDLLQTLPPREFSAGMSEVIKYGMLGDHDLFERLERADPPLAPDHPDLAEIVRTCCAIKAAIVRSDERETAASGGRALLNLGHTFAHAIEAVAGYGRYLHGEAVAVGLVLAARLSRLRGSVGPEEVARVEALVDRYRLPGALREPLPLGELVDAMSRDKKVRQGRLRFVVLEQLGQAATASDVPMDEVEGLWLEAGAVR